MIFEYPEDLLQLVNAYTSNIFTDVFFDRYSAFFDWLIADKQIRLSADTDLDLGNFIEKLSKIYQDPDTTGLLCTSVPCGVLFAFYYRYQILGEYLLSLKSPVKTCCRDGEKLFTELFLFVWENGIPSFSAKYL
mgnify:CR=1 FL=1